MGVRINVLRALVLCKWKSKNGILKLKDKTLELDREWSIFYTGIGAIVLFFILRAINAPIELLLFIFILGFTMPTAVIIVWGVRRICKVVRSFVLDFKEEEYNMLQSREIKKE